MMDPKVPVLNLPHNIQHERKHDHRASRTTDRDQGDEPTMTSEELRKLTIEHAGDNHHVDPWDAGAGSGFFGGGLGGGGGRGARGFGGAEAASQARSRRVRGEARSGLYRERLYHPSELGSHEPHAMLSTMRSVLRSTFFESG